MEKGERHRFAYAARVGILQLTDLVPAGCLPRTMSHFEDQGNEFDGIECACQPMSLHLSMQFVAVLGERWRGVKL